MRDWEVCIAGTPGARPLNHQRTRRTGASSSGLCANGHFRGTVLALHRCGSELHSSGRQSRHAPLNARPQLTPHLREDPVLATHNGRRSSADRFCPPQVDGNGDGRESRCLCVRGGDWPTALEVFSPRRSHQGQAATHRLRLGELPGHAADSCQSRPSRQGGSEGGR